MSRETTIETEQGHFVARPYQPEDETGVLEFRAEVFGKRISKKVWRWKYSENPYGSQILLCLDEDGRYAALYGGIPYDAHWMGDSVRMTQLMDNMSHPLYRGAGIFIRTANVFFDRYGGPHASVCMYGFPGQLHSDIGVRKLQYRSLPKGVNYLIGSTREIQNRVKPTSARLEPVVRPDTAVDQLWQDLRRDYPLSIVRDARFMSWRFGSHPEKSYEIWGYYPLFGKGLKAYAVLDVSEDEACLVDWLAPSSQKENEDFLARMAGDLWERGIETLKTWLPAGHFLTHAAMSAGLKTAPEPLGIVPTLRTFQSPFSYEWAAENLFYTMADGDLF